MITTPDNGTHQIEAPPPIEAMTFLKPSFRIGVAPATGELKVTVEVTPTVPVTRAVPLTTA